MALPSRGNTSLAAGWEYLLKVNGMTLNDLGAKSYGPVSSNAEAVKNRQAMAAGWFTVVPASFILDLGSAMQVRVLAGQRRGVRRAAQAQSGLCALHRQGRYLQGPGRHRGRSDLPVAHRADCILQDVCRRDLQDHQGHRRRAGGVRQRHQRHEGRDGGGDGAELRHAVCIPAPRNTTAKRDCSRSRGASRAQARRLRRAGRRRGGGRDVRLPRLRAADGIRSRSAGPALHHARLQPGAVVPVVASQQGRDTRSRAVGGSRSGGSFAGVHRLHVRELRLHREPFPHRRCADPNGHGGGNYRHPAGAGGDATHDRRGAADRGDRLPALRVRRPLVVRLDSTTGDSVSRSRSTRSISPPRAFSECR